MIPTKEQLDILDSCFKKLFKNQDNYSNKIDISCYACGSDKNIEIKTASPSEVTVKCKIDLHSGMYINLRFVYADDFIYEESEVKK